LTFESNCELDRIVVHAFSNTDQHCQWFTDRWDSHKESEFDCW
jgi:hypothetical protein